MKPIGMTYEDVGVSFDQLAVEYLEQLFLLDLSQANAILCHHLLEKAKVNDIVDILHGFIITMFLKYSFVVTLSFL
jgi:hypothetical protein